MNLPIMRTPVLGEPAISGTDVQAKNTSRNTPPPDQAQGCSLDGGTGPRHAVAVKLSVVLKLVCGVVAASQPSLAGIRERDEAWPYIVQDGDSRVIEDRDRLQWVLQRRRHGGGRWADLGYFRDRNVLIERCRMSVAAIEVLQALPPLHLGPGASRPKPGGSIDASPRRLPRATNHGKELR
jgi:hypothetical protein